MEGETCLFSMTVPVASLDTSFLQFLVELVRPSVILIEEAPAMFRHDIAAGQYYYLLDWAEKTGVTVVKVNPGQWKKMVVPIIVSGQHQSDAATMGKWYARSDGYKRLLKEKFDLE